jgi:hypothetical protein
MASPTSTRCRKHDAEV